MKRVRCPKCDCRIPFDETGYSGGEHLVFICPDCKKEFSIRLIKPGDKPASATDSNATPNQPERNWGSLVVVENVFAFRQVFQLKEGRNLIGRRNRGTEVDMPVETNDPSMDRVHCELTVKTNKQGEVTYLLHDCNSNTGTYVMNRLLGNKEQCRLAHGDVITLGATTLILHTENEMD